MISSVSRGWWGLGALAVAGLVLGFDITIEAGETASRASHWVHCGTGHPGTDDGGRMAMVIATGGHFTSATAAAALRKSEAPQQDRSL